MDVVTLYIHIFIYKNAHLQIKYYERKRGAETVKSNLNSTEMESFNSNLERQTHIEDRFQNPKFTINSYVDMDT